MSAAAGPGGKHPGVWVGEAFPGPLTGALAVRGGIPQDVRRVILSELDRGVPAAVLRLRIETRWFRRYSHLTGDQLAERCDTVAADLVAPSPCGYDCEGGRIERDDRPCPVCARGASRVDGVAGVDRSTPAPAEQQRRYAAEIRAAMRERHGVPAPRTPRRAPTTPAKPPERWTYTLREPEPPQPTPEQIERWIEQQRRAAVQRAAEERARADRKARATENRRNAP